MPGFLALVGGDEFKPGNEEQDRLLVAVSIRGPAYVIPTAAARQGPDQAVANAVRWFGGLGLRLDQLPILKRSDAMNPELAARAEEGGLFYLVGGDPGLVAQVLRGSRVLASILIAWRAGAAVAGSSAGAMALCSQTLVRATWPNRFRRRAIDALGVVPRAAVLPHYDTFGHRWVESAREALPAHTLIGIDERSAAVCFGDGRTWRAMGPGAVTVIKGKRTARFLSGAEVKGLPQLARMLPPP